MKDDWGWVEEARREWNLERDEMFSDPHYLRWLEELDRFLNTHEPERIDARYYRNELGEGL